MPWYTDEQLLALPAFASLAPEQIPRLVADAGSLYAYINANPGVADSDLRAWAEGAGILPERYNLACQALQQAGKGIEIATGPLVPASSSAPAQLSALSAGDSVPTEKLTETELRKAAKRLGLDLPKSATKAEIATAVSRL